MLVVGVSDSRYFKWSNQLERFLAEQRRVVGLFCPPLEGIRQSLSFPLVRGDGLALPFRDESFDYVFSNAVVEHVGDQAAQARFIGESRRVARQWCRAHHPQSVVPGRDARQGDLQALAAEAFS